MPSKKSYRKKPIKKGGDCGCNQHILGGGVLGPATAINVGAQNTIPFNNHNIDPLAPASQDATRMDPNPNGVWNPFLSGGQRSRGKRSLSKGKRSSGRKSKKNGGTRRKTRTNCVRGGDRNTDAIFNGPLYSTGTSMGAPVGSNIIMGNTLDILNPPKMNTSAPFI